jgi:5'-3' exonuclease
MGIKLLHKFLRKHAPEIYKDISLSDFSGKIISIDVSVYLYRYKSINKDRWLTAFSNLVLTLRKHKINCVFIYDTKAPIEKNVKKEERKTRKRNAEKRANDIKAALKKYEETGEVDHILISITEKRTNGIKKLLKMEETDIDREAIQDELIYLDNQVVNVSRHEIEMSKELLKSLNVPFFDSENEAETLCAHLCCKNKVDAVLSDDTDVLVYGTETFLTKLNLQNETCTVIHHTDVMKTLNLTSAQFIDFCIMCGTDYNKNMHRVGSEKSYKLIQKHLTLEAIEENCKDLDTSVLNYKRIREIFSVPDVIPEYNLENGEIDVDHFSNFAQRHGIPNQFQVSRNKRLL